MKQKVSGINNKIPLISIVTATYNCERYIDECLKSVASQKSNDFLKEHIVVDGLSSDNTVEILKKHQDVKWISETDTGQSDALNKGFLMAKGDWIILLDGDDYLLPGTLKLYHKAIKKGNVDIFAALYMALIFTIFSYFASLYSLNVNANILQKIFGVLTIIAGVYITFTTDNLNKN